MSANQVLKAIASRKPFSFLTEAELNGLVEASALKSYSIGQQLYTSKQIPEFVSFIFSGNFRLLVQDKSTNRIVTLTKYGPGRLLGWNSLLRASPCDHSICCNDAQILQIPSDLFVKTYLNNQKFSAFLDCKVSEQEAYLAMTHSNALHQDNGASSLDKLPNFISSSSIRTIQVDKNILDDLGSICVQNLDTSYGWLLTTGLLDDYPIGQAIDNGFIFNVENKLKVPLRLIGTPLNLDLSLAPQNYQESDQIEESLVSSSFNTKSSSIIESKKSFSLEELGIVEADDQNISDKYPFIQGKTEAQKSLAVCQMLALYDNLPFRRDAIQKVLEDHLRRDKQYSLPMLGGLFELMGYRCLVGSTKSENLLSLDYPAVVFIEDNPVILFGRIRQELIIANPNSAALQSINITDLLDDLGDSIDFVLPQKTSTTPQQTLNWSWFLPLINKYKKSLILVFAASLLAQLFGLAIPLMIQQIIDKVLTQGNLNSLNLIGTAMIVFAFFQGILIALRSYIFVDTTDRMDLTLGSTVIQRLLSLPLGYFDKRPVGELSQRLGELNTIRGFLTGTALVSSLNIVFALIYLVVMFLYSPVLSIIALSTIPLYIIVVFVVSPIYKSLIRKRAVAQAKTQSHLIEVLNGIQTVKAQHFELTARWKWQDKYRHFVDEGFKSSVLGVASGEIGKFLNTISGLLVLWFGMWLVLDGQLTLGMLIAFRIISNNVTGPLLQLSGLYQSFQGVQLSMERLSDVIDQRPELDSSSSEVGKIILPPIQGDIEFRDVYFKFNQTGSYQIDGVNAFIERGSFVGIVGQSGSGKSTLMKLVPKLYKPEKGQILVDGYDIDKVDLASLRRQVGIVPQDSILFEGSIADNIALNDPNSTTDSIIEAAKIACAHDFIMELDQGYATRIAERGSNLSGGQRQRIAVARTILADPQLLILDEATSALDFNTERQLCENLYAWAKNKTVFFITHRLSTIQSSDLIIVMNKGQIVETGQHRSLMESKGRYFALYQQQQMGI